MGLIGSNASLECVAVARAAMATSTCGYGCQLLVELDTIAIRIPHPGKATVIELFDFFDCDAIRLELGEKGTEIDTL